MKLRLHSRAQNSAGERVRIALHLKGVDYEYVPVLDVEEYRLINPLALMPALEVGPDCLNQSLAIIEYLEEVFPDPTILPATPIARAQSRAFAMSISGELHALTVRRVRKRLAQASDKLAVADWYRHWTATTFGALEEALEQRRLPCRFAFADYPTMADIALVPQMANARRFECDLSPYPLLSAVEAACNDLAAFHAARPDRQTDFT